MGGSAAVDEKVVVPSLERSKNERAPITNGSLAVAAGLEGVFEYRVIKCEHRSVALRVAHKLWCVHDEVS